ncbi:MAG: glycosyltransferase family 9 protein [Agriterribacter sp.]
MIRHISVILRKLQGAKTDRRLLATFASWKNSLNNINKATPSKNRKKLLIIRLDDIGDYLLFRNFLPMYKQSQNWLEYEITYMGNVAVKTLFDMLDAKNVDKTIWIDKKRYFSETEYRKSIWEELSRENFEAVINPSRTRQLLLDDICIIATNATIKSGVENTFEAPEVNYASNQLYQKLFKDIPNLHEFLFNKAFAKWNTGVDNDLHRPEILYLKAKPPLQTPYILLCIGAAHKSKRWPVSKWIDLIKLITDNKLPIAVISGGGTEKIFAQAIAGATGARDIAGATTLPEMIDWMNHAAAAVCNDSMAAHLAVSCKTPLVMLSNGNKYYRFTAYYEAGIKNVTTVYATPFLKKWKSKKQSPHKHYIPVTKDMETIKPGTVFKALQQLLQQNP